MKKYQYQIVRYMHDQFTGEFLNIGVIVYSPEINFLKIKIINKFDRISKMFPASNGKFIKNVLRCFETGLNQVAIELNTFFRPSVDLSVITNKILPKDDSAIQLSEVRHGIDIDFEAALYNLSKALVDKYTVLENDNSISDNDVWKNLYKRYFDKYGITERLVNHVVITSDDTFTFEKSWKNDIWHCFQPVSFALQNKEKIKNKVYQWSGKIEELKNTEERMHLTFLTKINSENNELKEFINTHLKKNENKLIVDVISEQDAENTAKKIHEQMSVHDNHIKLTQQKQDKNSLFYENKT